MKDFVNAVTLALYYKYKICSDFFIEYKREKKARDFSLSLCMLERLT